MTNSIGFDKVRFEELMSTGVQLHSIGNYWEARNVRIEAYDLAPQDTIESGRAARDIAASLDRMDQPSKAVEWAQKAFEIHDGIFKEEVINSRGGSNRQTCRERAATSVCLGVCGLRGIIGRRLQGRDFIDMQETEVLEYFSGGWNGIQFAKELADRSLDQRVDQYEINMARRVAIAEALLGEKTRALKLGAKAVALAKWSESPRLDTTNRNLNRLERREAKIKALKGGMAALAIGLSRFIPGKKAERYRLQSADFVL